MSKRKIQSLLLCFKDAIIKRVGAAGSKSALLARPIRSLLSLPSTNREPPTRRPLLREWLHLSLRFLPRSPRSMTLTYILSVEMNYTQVLLNVCFFCSPSGTPLKGRRKSWPRCKGSISSASSSVPFVGWKHIESEFEHFHFK